MSKALLIAQYCTMEKNESALSNYLRYKENMAKASKFRALQSKGGYVKSEMFERHYLNNVEGINANVVKKIEGLNNHNAKKIENYVVKKVYNNPSMANHLC